METLATAVSRFAKPIRLHNERDKAMNRPGNGTVTVRNDPRRTIGALTTEERQWGWPTVAAGLVATVSYALMASVHGTDPGSLAVQLLLAFAFAFALSIVSIGLYFVAGGPRSNPVALVGAVFNVVAGALLLTMALVQLSMKSVADPPGEMFRAVYFGLDVAWDLYIGSGTLLFAIALRKHDWFRGRFAWPGVVVSLALIVLNIVTFPKPPASSGLIDPGPLVGLWYTAVSVWIAYKLLRHGGRDRLIEAEPPSRALTAG